MTLTQEMIEYIGFDNEEWNWEHISIYIRLTLPFVKKYRNKLYVGELSDNESLTQEIIEYIGVDNKEWNWKYITQHIKLTLPFVKKYKDKLEMWDLSKNDTLAQQMIWCIGVDNKWNCKYISRYIRLDFI